MNEPCGCCAGIEIVTPESEVNRPGLTAIAYRVGTHATFFESMLARLSNLYLDLPSPDGSGALERIYPLRHLTTREPSDPSIALLDAWATVADVLTFYQERIANEGYLGTSTERLSILELAKLVGYKLRPGVSASVFLAFTVSDGFKGTIPKGTRAQSIPGTGQMPQFFETSADLAARDTWNDLGVRLTRPQVITLASDPMTRLPATIDEGTDATTRETLYFKGMATNLKAGDALLIVSGDGPGQQVLRIVESVDAQANQQRTEVTLQEPLVTVTGTTSALTNIVNVLQPFINDASTVFPGSALAAQVAQILQGLISNAQTFVQNNPTTASATALGQMVQAAIPQVQQQHDIAAKRQFTRLEPWIARILDALITLADQLPSLDGGDFVPGLTISGTVEAVPSALGSLFGIVDQLALPPSLQPANTLRLARSVAQTFTPQSDTAPRLLAAFKPAVATTLYQAWGAIETAPSPIQVFAMRVKASLFGNNAPLRIQISPQDGSVTSVTDWPVIDSGAAGNVPHESPRIVSLDASYDKILPASWIVVQTTATTLTTSQTLYAKAKNPTSVSRGDYGISGKTTQIELSDPASPTANVSWITSDLTTIHPSNTPPNDDFRAIRETVVYAQPEELDLAEEPLDRDVAGNTIELDGLYNGLESGRWIIVSGNRTDITDSTGATSSTGVAGNELVMLAAVTQGPSKQSCRALTLGAVPFSSVYQVTAPNDAGDRLVVARPNLGLVQFLQLVPLPNAVDQQICDPVELAPGLYANAYIPTAAERVGDFSAFGSLLLDPATNQPFSPAGVIPPGRMDSNDPNNPAPVWAWRISNIASGQDALHTTLVLANGLAYTYDSSTLTIYGNVAKATHGQTVGEVLGNGDGSQSLQRFRLGQSPLTYVPDPSPAGAKSTLVVRVNEVEWHEANNLAGLGPRDRDYVTETDNADKTAVIFGTGEHGARLPTGNSNVKATYRYGIGKAGNVAAQQISQLASQPLGLKGVINPLRASGGADRDSRNQTRGNAPLAVEALDRLVSVEDYAAFARTFAGIAKTSSARLSDGRRLIVHVTIAGVDDIPIDPNSDLYLNLVQALHQNGDPYQPIEVALRKLKLLVISAGVKVLPDYAWESVVPRVRAALLNTFGLDQRDLGQSAFLGEVISTIQNVEGVSYVNVTTFDSVAEDVTAEQLASLAATLTLQDVVEADLAQVDPTQTDPTKRIVPAELAILTPDIPDTLILTQITT
jgi:hypothetical protein